MATAGPNNPGTCASDAAVGTLPWATPANAATSNDVYTSAAYPELNSTVYTRYLKCTNFGFAIPDSATISGIQVDIERKASTGSASANAKDYVVKLVNASGTVGGDNKAATSTNWPTTDAYAHYGGVADTWGGSWTYSDINNSNFGMVLQAVLYSNNFTTVTTRVDHITITITYTEGGGGNAYTLTAAAGALTLTGTTAGLKAARKLTAAVNAYTLTGNAVSLRHGYTMGAAAGAYTLTGQTTGLRAARKLGASTGTLVLVGNSTGLLFGRKVAATPGAFSLAGQDAGLRAARLLAGGTGAFVLTGNAAGLTVAQLRRLLAEAGVFGLTGQPAELRAARKLTAATVNYTLTGAAAQLAAGRFLAAASAAYTLAGAAVGLLAARRLAVDTGVYVLVGVPVTLWQDIFYDALRARLPILQAVSLSASYQGRAELFAPLQAQYAAGLGSVQAQADNLAITQARAFDLELE